jgi:putative heme iron utilization protein
MVQPPPLPAAAGRTLLRGCDRATLATSLAGAPYASLVMAATAADGAPLLLISDLAQHTANIKGDPRVALLFDGTGGLDEPLTGPRVTVLGRAERSADAPSRARYLARHPSADLYAGFADFHLYRVAVERAHLVAGFGRIDWIAANDLLPPGIGALAAVEDSIIRHMNEDHADAVALYARVLLGRPGEGWRITGIDAEGIDLRRAGTVARLDFPAPVADAEAARAALAQLAKSARAEQPDG